MPDENAPPRTPDTDLAKTGIDSLDTILGGGWTTDRVYLIEGEPGTGKTTLSLQFLLEGVAAGQRGLYVTLSETENELRAVAASHGWSLDGIDIYQLDVADSTPEGDNDYLMFEPSEVELGQTIAGVLVRSKRSIPPASLSIRCRRCGCWPRIRFVTGVKSSRSNSFLSAVNAPC